MDERELRRFCRRTLTALDLRPPLSAEELCARLGSARGRAIVLVARDLDAANAFGCLVPMRTRDLIVHDANLSRAHRDHVVFHEVVHLLRGHVDRTATQDGPLICGPRPAGAAQGTLYDSGQEWEAETGATIFSTWAQTEPGAPTPTEPVASAITRALVPSAWR